MQWWQIYVAAGAAAALLSLILTRMCRLLAPTWGFVDRPLGEGHKRHARAVPVLGGLIRAAETFFDLIFALEHGGRFIVFVRDSTIRVRT